jgi:hypothetical protein
MRQEDVASAAGVSHAAGTRLERGMLEAMPLGRLGRTCALDMRVTVRLQGAGAELDRVLGEAHSVVHEEGARLFAALEDWVDGTLARGRP